MDSNTSNTHKGKGKALAHICMARYPWNDAQQHFQCETITELSRYRMQPYPMVDGNEADNERGRTATCPGPSSAQKQFLRSSCFPRHPLGDPWDSPHPQWPVISYMPLPLPLPPPPPSHLHLSPVPCMPLPGTAGDPIIIGSNSSDKEPSSEEMPSVEEKEYSSVEEKQYSSIEEQDYFSAKDDNPNVVPS
ncbi:hypothetical protein FRC11_008255, partial [Ceratobasidium sp. 423]